MRALQAQGSIDFGWGTRPGTETARHEGTARP